MQEIELNKEEIDVKKLNLLLARSGTGVSRQLLLVLCDLVGEETFLELLRIFAGNILYFPSTNTIANCYISLLAYTKVKKNPERKDRILKTLSTRYGQNVNALYKVAEECLKDIVENKV